VRLATQLAIAVVITVALGASGFVYHRLQTDGEAAAAVGRGPEAVPVALAAAEAGTIRERIARRSTSSP
jgi:hypothetical protein